MRALAVVCLSLFPAAHSVTLLPLGDSITFGAGSSAGPANNWSTSCGDTCGGYRAPLWASLTSAGFNVSTVGSLRAGPAWLPASANLHEGHSGWRIAQLTGILPTWAAFEPDVITLLAATNDVGTNHTLAQILADMESLLSATAAALPRAKVLVGTVLNMVNSLNPQWSTMVRAVNEALPALVAKYGYVLVDLAGASGLCTPDASPLRRLCAECNSPTMCNSTYYDRVHPTAAGYDLLAGVWAAALGPVLEALAQEGMAGVWL